MSNFNQPKKDESKSSATGSDNTNKDAKKDDKACSTDAAKASGSEKKAS